MSQEHDLKWWLDDQRAELDMTWDELAASAGVSKETLFKAGSGRAMRPRTKKAIERALQWDRGSVDDILAGGKPTPLAEEPELTLDDLVADIDALRKKIADLQRQSEAVQKRDRRPPRTRYASGNDPRRTSNE